MRRRVSHLRKGYEAPNSTILSSFAAPNTIPDDLAFDGTNLLSFGISGTDTVYKHSGVTSSILTSFTTSSISNIGFHSGNLLSYDSSTGRLNTHSGFSATVSTFFNMPAGGADAFTVVDGNLISINGGTDVFQVHSGITATVNSTFAVPDPGNMTGVTYDGRNLISCSDSTDLIYIHDGLSATVLSSFAAPSTRPTGLTFDGENLISCDRDSDLIYIHGKG